MTLLILTTMFVSFVAAKLKVMAPQSLADEFKDQTIPAEYANFGYIPYGQTVMGRLHFQPDNQYACDEFELGTKTEINRSGEITPFYMAMRGGDCSFVQKVRNMENIGTSVGIIINNSEENPDGRPVMFDDGTGGGIRIPSMMISKDDGLVLMNWLKNASKADYQNIVVMAEFVANPLDDNRVHYEMWLTSTSNRALDFLEDFERFHTLFHNDEQLEDNVKFEPRYIFWSCDDCEEEFIERECYGNGKYCAIDMDPIMPGREVIDEDLR